MLRGKADYRSEYSRACKQCQSKRTKRGYCIKYYNNYNQEYYTACRILQKIYRCCLQQEFFCRIFEISSEKYIHYCKYNNQQNRYHNPNENITVFNKIYHKILSSLQTNDNYFTSRISIENITFSLKFQNTLLINLNV